MRLALLLVVACAKPVVKEPPPLADPVATNEGDRVSAMKTELENDIFESYDRDEAPEIETGMLSPAIGGARIGVGPSDLLIGQALQRAPSRWPLAVDRNMFTSVKSKRLAVSFALDETAAWMSDEVSWRVTLCQRSAVLPMRITGLYAHDGDRWVPVFEHVAFAHTPAPARDGQLHGSRVTSAVVSRDLADDLSRVLGPLLSRTLARDPLAISTGPEALLLGPAVDAEWAGGNMLVASLAAGPMIAEDRRVGTVGRSVAKATIAYWIGNLVADLPARPGVPAGKVRLRGSFIFERRKPGDSAAPLKPGTNPCATEQQAGDKKPKGDECRWVLVQGHISEPIDDLELAQTVFGTSLESLNPLKLTCADGRRPATALPAGSPRPAQGAAGSP